MKLFDELGEYLTQVRGRHGLRPEATVHLFTIMARHPFETIETLCEVGVLEPAGQACVDCGVAFVNGKPLDQRRVDPKGKHTHRFTDPPLRRVYAAPEEASEDQ